MEYITTGDRIAVENFEIGSIYKVTFLNETEVYFMCCGKGKDFVMLMSNEPRLFSLTMSSAAEVVAIEDYTPLPPPTPPTNLLQYQTGEPPFSFTTTDTELFSWYIKGPAGEKTANLFDVSKVVSGDLTVSGTTITKGSSAYNIDLFSGLSGASTAMSTNSMVLEAGTYTLAYDLVTGNVNLFLICVCPYTSATREPVDKYFDGYNGKSFTLSEKSYVSLRVQQNTAVEVKDVALYSGSTAPPSYEPYGMYKIPILCNTTTSIIYIEEALGENDVLYSTDTTYKIATELGENLLQVQGETQPSEMQIVYKWVFEYE